MYIFLNENYYIKFYIMIYFTFKYNKEMIDC